MGKGKKKKGKGKAKPEPDPNALTEVDRTFYELQIVDLNRRLARLRSLTEELQVQNEKLENDSKQLDTDRNDVIIYLKRILQEKSDEIAEYQQKITKLEETQTDETEKFKQTITEMEEDYNQMQMQLNSEIKLLTGKLNALEEFRLQRDDLMKKFETQEEAMENQERRHKREIYDNERKLIIDKDKLKKSMEARLIQLSNEFQEVTQIRIASTTHRVIRENIAINNELDTMLETHNHYHNENERLKNLNRTLKQEAKLHDKEKKKALGTVNLQLAIITRFTAEHEKLSGKLKALEKVEAENLRLECERLNLCQLIDKQKINIRILEQNLHASRSDRTTLRIELSATLDKVAHLTAVVEGCTILIKKALQDIAGESDTQHQDLYTNLLNLITTPETRMRKTSLESLESLTAMYASGDLGFEPKPGPYRKQLAVKRNVELQVGDSIEVLPPLTARVSESIRRSTLLSIVESKSSVREESAKKSEEKLLFTETSAGSSIVDSEDEIPLLHLEMSAIKQAAAASAAKVSEQMRRASSSRSAIKNSSIDYRRSIFESSKSTISKSLQEIPVGRKNFSKVTIKEEVEVEPTRDE